MEILAQAKNPYEKIEGSAPRPWRRFVMVVVSILLTAAVVTVVATAGRSHPESPTPTQEDLPSNKFGSTGILEEDATCPFTSSPDFQAITIGSRYYQVYVPQGITFPAAAVFLWHGISSSPAKIEAKVGLKLQADSKKFIAVYPETSNRGALLAAWNGAGCCNQNFEDVKFGNDIIADLTSTKGCVNANRVYFMGFSNGGFMTNRFACENPTKLRAGCVHSGLIGDYSGDVTKSPWKTCSAVPMVGIHGTSDTTVSIDGGKQPTGNAQWFSFPDTMAIWEKAAGCTNMQSTNAVEGGKTVITRSGTCSKAVKSYTINGHGHDWWSTATDKCMAHFTQYGL